MFSSITALFSAIAEVFKFKTTKQEKLVENEHIKDYKSLQKACNYAEEAFLYASKHATIDFDTYKQQKRFDALLEKFRKYK